MANIRRAIYSDIEFPWSLGEEENVEYVFVIVELEPIETVIE